MALDLNYIREFFLTASPWQIYWALLVNGGWLIFVYLTFYGAIELWVHYRQGHFLSQFKWIFLAIAIPKGNEQTPKAVEQIFAQLAGSHKNPDLEEAYISGFMPRWFSLEIVSLEGYIQFIIGTEVKRRDLVEAAIYAQYPDAEITEIEDYTKGFPDHFPNPDYQCFGSEFILARPWVYPIRTYSEFEHTAAEEIFKDPMAALLEALARIGRGEYVWLQILVKPIVAKDWQKEGLEEVKKLIGAEVEEESQLPLVLRPLAFLGHSLIKTAEHLLFTLLVQEPPTSEKEDKDKARSEMLFLSPGEKTTVEKIEKKISKLGFATKIRYLYMARHEVFNRRKISYGLVGAFKQFNDETSNGIKSETKKTMTKVHFFFKEPRDNWRRNKLVRAYKTRSRWRGTPEFVLNIEELASIWHFPALTVKAPLVSKTEAKLAEPPIDLPTEREFTLKTKEIKLKAEAPPNLPT